MYIWNEMLRCMNRNSTSMIILFLSSLFFITCNKDENPSIRLLPDSLVEVGAWDDFSITDPVITSQQGIDMAGYWPDGKISAVKDGTSGKFTLYWGEKYSIRTAGSTPFPEDHINQVLRKNRVFGLGFNEVAGFYDGGAWFIGVHELDDGRLAGFFHAESNWGGLMAYKSIGVAYSSDNGHTWTEGKKILNVNYQKPTKARWSGLGDGCVVYNERIKQFVCYYSAYAGGGDYKICMATSADPSGAPETWKKWDGEHFSVIGYSSKSNIGGVDHEIAGLTTRSGSNPSVLWNEYLQRWVMVYAGWNKVLYMSASEDGIEWERPIAITDAAKEAAGYPNLISEYGDLVGGSVIKLYYGRNQNAAGVRQFAYRNITYAEK